MPLWDSVQRSLEKASQEAARIARTQRLRSMIEGLTRQIQMQNNAIVNKAMELYVSGQLTQSELVPICQEMLNLHQQLNLAQSELKQLQMQASQAQNTPGSPPPVLPSGAVQHQYPPPGTGGAGQASYTPSTTEQNPPFSPTPEYQSYMDSTNSYTVPPPPPGVEQLTVSSIDTMLMATPLPPVPPASASHAASENRLCSVCSAIVQPETAFCHNCGSPVQEANVQHLPTMRGGTLEHFYAEGQPTRFTTAGHTDAPLQEETNAPVTGTSETVRATPPAQTPSSSNSDASSASTADKEVEP